MSKKARVESLVKIGLGNVLISLQTRNDLDMLNRIVERAINMTIDTSLDDEWFEILGGVKERPEILKKLTLLLQKIKTNETFTWSETIFINKIFFMKNEMIIHKWLS